MAQNTMTRSNSSAAPTALTPAQLAAMDVQSRNAYFASLPSNQQAAQRQAYQNYRASMNKQYMRTTLRNYAVCPPQSGNATSQNYALGTQLIYNVPSAENGFLEGFKVRVSVTMNFAVGTSAVYALTAAGALALIQEIDLLYGNIQLRFRPYILRSIAYLMGYQANTVPSSVTAGTQNSTIQGYVNSGFAVATGAQTWTFEFDVPLNFLHPQDVRGLLPIMGGETTAQINIQTASALMGNDPELFPTYAVSGTGNAVTLTSGTVQCIAYYRNGISLQSPVRQGLDLSGLPTLQMDIDPPLNNLVAGSVLRQKINKAEYIAIAILTIIDGNQSNKFAALTNIQEIELGRDSSGTNKFWQFGIGTNLNVYEYFYDQIRGRLGDYRNGQDLPDEGILPIVIGPTYGESDAQNDTGILLMNTTPGGWTDVNYGLQVGSVSGVANINPRVVCHLIFVNPTGLIVG